ncbi:hypothetical protein WMY93_034318 [Mugilogobius chulae]|uniref:PiggyBac transposable element-derived protein domain-containing protein n=1 Tax=Mugilogobius chulae TaxID=88201 RepID=A0AAW0MNU2_9GOBI
MSVCFSDSIKCHSPADGARWCNIDEPDSAPEELKFRPTRRVGPQLNLTSKYSPLELFQLFFSFEVVSSLVRNTNAYVKHSGASPANVTLKDMYSYIALVLYMGVVPLKTLLDYWKSSRLYALPFPSNTMNRLRFNEISGCLHMNHPDAENANELHKGTPRYDKLCKVRPLYEQILQACQAYYHPKQHISIDERMVASKARIGFKQYIKNKPTKWGFKLFVLADSSGYTVNFFVYDGKVGEPSGFGQSFDVVMRLLNSTNLGTGYKLYVDNYYTSPVLFRKLLKRRISACGTIRSTLKDYPKRAETRCLQSSARDDPVAATKRVTVREMVRRQRSHALLHDAQSQRQRFRQTQSEKRRGEVGGEAGAGSRLRERLQPAHGRSGLVRRAHQLVQRRAQDEEVVQDAVLSLRRHRAERRRLSAAIPVKLPQSLATTGEEEEEERDLGLVHLGHLPAAFAEQLKDVPSRLRGTRGRRTCVMCGSKTQVYCSVCLKTMCFNSSRNCYREFHGEPHHIGPRELLPRVPPQKPHGLVKLQQLQELLPRVPPQKPHGS